MAAANLSKTQKIAFCALMSAVCVVLMAVSRVLPIGIYAIPAVSSVFVMIVLIELGVKWSIGCYVVTALISVLLAEPETAMMFVALFGYYPIFKVLLERIQLPAVRWLSKLLFFNVTIVAGYFVLSLFASVLDEVAQQSPMLLAVMVIAVEIVFVLYDICISRMSVFYIRKYHGYVAKIFKK